MISPRSLLIAALLAIPVLAYLLLSIFALYDTGRLTWLAWLAPVCGGAAWVIGKLWRPAASEVPAEHRLEAARHWTPRDERAAEIVRAYQLRLESTKPAELVDPAFYQRQIESLALDVTKVYHPQARDPFSSLTVPEVLAAARLACDDIEQWMLTSVPGSKLLTLQQWRSLKSAPDLVRKLSNVGWAAAILFNPANLVRYVASQWTWGPVTHQLQGELLAVFYLRVIRQVGFYLIEMNSGRLRGGADVYRATFDVAPGVVANAARAFPGPPPVTIAIIGQVSSGKSSLINHLTGGSEAKVDILPQTRQVSRHRFELDEVNLDLTLLDTPGYGEAGANREQLAQIEIALQTADAALLVMDGHSPAREADRKTLIELHDRHAGKANLKLPPVVGILSHVDLLEPPLEWSPPYDWRAPRRPKEQSIQEAVEYVREVFGKQLRDVVPACLSHEEGRQWGIVEEVIPAVVSLLDEAATVALLRSYEKRLDADRWKALAGQLARTGKQFVQTWLEERLPPRPGTPPSSAERSKEAPAD
jgi:predicted GTPase